MTIKQSDLLHTNRFFPLFATQFLGALNANIFKTVLIGMIAYRMTHSLDSGAGMLMSVVAAAFIIPYFLFSSLAGQLADKYQKSKLLQFIKATEILIAVIAGIGFYLDSTTMLITVLFLIGTEAAFFGPLKFAMLPDQLHQDELMAGNALLLSSLFIGVLVGSAIGGILVRMPISYLIVPLAMMAVAVIGFYISLSMPGSKLGLPSLKINLNVLQESWAIVGETFKNDNLYVAIIGISWFWLIIVTYISRFPNYVQHTLGAGSALVAVLLACFTTGISAGALLCHRLLKGKLHATYVPIAALGMSIFAIDLVIASKHADIDSGELVSLVQFLSHAANWHVLVDLFLMAVCAGIYIVPLYAILQLESSDENRSRVIASSNIMNAVFLVASSIGVAVLLFLHLSITKIFVMIALANLFAAIYICKLLPEELVKSLLIWLLKAFYRAEVVGMENYYAAGNRALIVSNHTSFLDALLLCALLPDRLSFAINTHVANQWWVKLMLKLVNTFSVDPTNPLATKSLIEYLERNHRVVIFPEGRITVTGALMKIYEGPGLIADKADAFLLPIRIDGAQYTHFSRLRGKVKMRWFPKITLTILPPKKFDIPPTITGRERRQLISMQLYDLMSDSVFSSSYSNETLYQALLSAKTVHGGRRIILEDIDRQPMNYNRLILRSIILSRLIAKKTTKGEHVGIMLPNSIANVATFFAMHLIHRVPAMLNFGSGIQNILSTCATVNVRTVYTSRRFIQHADLYAVEEALLSQGIKLIYLEDVRANISLFDKLFGFVVSKFPLRYYNRINKIDESNQDEMAKLPAVILFTSGSEGAPKAVVLSHANLQANFYQVAARVDFNPTDRILNALPMFHSFGLNSATLLPVLTGMYAFMYPSPLHYKIVPEICYDVNATIIFGTDTFFNNYAKYAHPYNFYSIRYAFAGAERLRTETRKLWIDKFGIRIMEGYGVTETAPVISVNTTMQYKAGTVGRMLPGMEYRIEPVEGISDGGLLFVKGPNVMLGYMLSQAPGKLVPPQEGWHDTGDVVAVDEEGYLTIKDRVKRFAKIAGEMVSLAAVEQAVNALWPDNKSAAISVPDDRKGEQIVLYTDNANAQQSEMINYFKQCGLAEIYLPRKIVIVAELPLLGSGKTDYTGLKKQALAQAVVQPVVEL